MSRDPVTIAADATVLDAAQTMVARKIGGLPVLAGGVLVGMITESDLMRLLIAESAAVRAGHNDLALV